MWTSAQSAAPAPRKLGPRINRGAIMSTILPTSALAQPFALSTTFLDELQPLAPLTALEPAAIAALDNAALTPAASSQVDLSSVAQFQSALAQSHQLLDELQTPVGHGGPAASTQQLNSIDQLNTLTDAAQNLVAAFNLLQSDNASAPASAVAEAPLLNNLLHSVTQPNPAADASQAAGPATLADIGISLQPAPAIDGGANLTLNAQALQTAYAANPQGTVALLNQTTDTFEQLGDQYALQASDAASLAVATPAAVAANNLVSQSSLADLALLDAFSETASAALPAGSVDTLSEQLAQIQEEQLTQQQLDVARDAFTTQTAALPAATDTPAAPASAVPLNTDPFSTNPALAAAIAAYRIGGAAAVASRAAPAAPQRARSEERRVGKECRSRWSPY